MFDAVVFFLICDLVDLAILFVTCSGFFQNGLKVALLHLEYAISFVSSI